jgi:hypothetical protein
MKRKPRYKMHVKPPKKKVRARDYPQRRRLKVR